MRAAKHFSLGLGTLAAMLLAVGCRDSVAPERSLGMPNLHPEGDQQQCPIGKFTGGGRIDPGPENTLSGKVTFGFNIFLDQNCGVRRGQLQVVHHPSQTKYHAGTTSSGGSIDSAFPTEECAEDGSFEGGVHVFGTVRVKHGNGPWHDEPFQMRVCDNGEPGRGHDTFGFLVDQVEGDASAHGSTGDQPLTGGNIQAH